MHIILFVLVQLSSPFMPSKAAEPAPYDGHEIAALKLPDNVIVERSGR